MGCGGRVDAAGAWRGEEIPERDAFRGLEWIGRIVRDARAGGRRASIAAAGAGGWCGQSAVSGCAAVVAGGAAGAPDSSDGRVGFEQDSGAGSSTIRIAARGPDRPEPGV